MPKITDIPPAYIQKELAVLQEDLDRRIPAKELDKNVLICTWNIRAFGGLTEEWDAENRSPKRDLHSLLCIVEVLKRFDIIAVQEVTGDFKVLRHALKLLFDTRKERLLNFVNFLP